MQNFFDCTHSRKKSNCPFEIGLCFAVTCHLVITSYREKRTARWDEKTEEVVRPQITNSARGGRFGLKTHGRSLLSGRAAPPRR
jgi:hypothetical protein